MANEGGSFEKVIGYSLVAPRASSLAQIADVVAFTPYAYSCHTVLAIKYNVVGAIGPVGDRIAERNP